MYKVYIVRKRRLPFIRAPKNCKARDSGYRQLTKTAYLRSSTAQNTLRRRRKCYRPFVLLPVPPTPPDCIIAIFGINRYRRRWHRNIVKRRRITATIRGTGNRLRRSRRKAMKRLPPKISCYIAVPPKLVPPNEAVVPDEYPGNLANILSCDRFHVWSDSANVSGLNIHTILGFTR